MSLEAQPGKKAINQKESTPRLGRTLLEQEKVQQRLGERTVVVFRYILRLGCPQPHLPEPQLKMDCWVWLEYPAKCHLVCVPLLP